jgi:predicted dehydrogenase
MAKDVIGWGVIGCGTIGPWHAKAVNRLPETRLVAACDVIPERAQQLAQEYGAARWYADYEKLLADPEVDAVSICTPSGLHSDLAVAAAQAGKHALSEKPMDITLAKADAMIAAHRAAGTRLAVIFQRRTSPLWQYLQRVVSEGRLGHMVLGDAYLKYYRSQEYYDSAEWRGTWALDGGGALMNQGVHCIDLLRWVMGPVDTIFAFAAPLVRKIEVEDTAVAALRFANGAFGVLQGTTSVTPGLDHRLEFHGELGSIRVDGEKVVGWQVPGVEAPATQEEGGSAAADPADIGTDGHTIQMRDLVAAIREDRPPMVSGEDARAAVEVILGVYQSARTGQPVRLPLPS